MSQDDWTQRKVSSVQLLEKRVLSPNNTPIEQTTVSVVAPIQEPLKDDRPSSVRSETSKLPRITSPKPIQVDDTHTLDNDEHTQQQVDKPKVTGLRRTFMCVHSANRGDKRIFNIKSEVPQQQTDVKIIGPCQALHKESAVEVRTDEIKTGTGAVPGTVPGGASASN